MKIPALSPSRRIAVLHDISDEVLEELRAAIITELCAHQRGSGAKCVVCGRSMDENPISLSFDEVEALGLLITKFGGGLSKLSEAKLEGHIYARISSLKYFGLTEGKRAEHNVTDLGYEFWDGQALVPKTLYMFNKKIVGEEGPMVSIYDILDAPRMDGEAILEHIRARRRRVSAKALEMSRG